MFRLLPVIFTSSDHIFAGKPMRIEKNVRRMQQICAYVMKHYVHSIALDDIAAEVGMNRSAFCSYFKRCKGMTFSQFVTQYRLNTACDLLKHSQKGVSEICYLVGFNDLPHFVRVFTSTMGMPPSKYRKQFKAGNGWIQFVQKSLKKRHLLLFNLLFLKYMAKNSPFRYIRIMYFGM